MTKDYYSNCLFETIKAKIKWGKRVKIIYIPSWKNEVFCPHFMWHDLTTDTIKDFHAEHGYVEKWYNLFYSRDTSDVAHIQFMKDG